MPRIREATAAQTSRNSTLLGGANPTKVGTTAFRLAIAAYIVPFVFCFQPTLIMIVQK